MLLLLFGSSAAGKTYALDELRRHGTDLAIHDFDEIGVPPGADRAWRHRGNEAWVGRALDYQADGRDLLLAGQTPLGRCWLALGAAARGDLSLPDRLRRRHAGRPPACARPRVVLAQRGRAR